MANIVAKENLIKGVFLNDSSSKNTNVLKGIKNFYTDNGLTPFLEVTDMNVKDDTCKLHYSEYSDDGHFINFAGVMVNSESLYVALGYNANNSLYIPVVSMLEILNISIFGDEKGPIGKDEALYILENSKLNYKDFDLKSYCREILVGNVVSTGYKFSSLILNFVETGIKAGANVAGNTGNSILDSMSNEDLYRILFEFMKRFTDKMDNLGKEFFGNFIAEEDRGVVMQSSAFGFDKLFKNFGVKSYESLYLKNINSRGLDPSLARELSSIGFGIKGRRDIYNNTTDDFTKMLAVLSSNAYIDHENINYNAIDDEKINTYNIVDLLRGVGKEQDLVFSVDVMQELGKDQLYNLLLNKLSITSDIAKIGNNRFFENLNKYTGKAKTVAAQVDKAGTQGVMNRVDVGSVYTRKVEGEQTNFVTFSSRALINAGKLFDRIALRILKVFK